jgi:hypothetical protein
MTTMAQRRDDDRTDRVRLPSLDERSALEPAGTTGSRTRTDEAGGQAGAPVRQPRSTRLAFRRALGSTDGLRQALLLREVLGLPKALDPRPN